VAGAARQLENTQLFATAHQLEINRQG
jgi:hypothetical protein